MIGKPILKVKDHPTLYRDPNSKAILVVDQTARQNYINQRTLAQNTANSTENLQQEMSSIKQELNELKDMLRILTGQSKTDK
jgi:SOS response regulatory protein OraA/RecX